MIKLVNNFIVGNTQEELEALQLVLADFSASFNFSIISNDGEQNDVFPLKLLITLNDNVDNPPMDLFLQDLQSKIDQVNN